MSVFGDNANEAVIALADMERMSEALCILAARGCAQPKAPKINCARGNVERRFWCASCIAAYGLGRIE